MIVSWRYLVKKNFCWFFPPLILLFGVEGEGGGRFAIDVGR